MFNNKINKFFLLVTFVTFSVGGCSSCKKELLETKPRDVVTPDIALADFSGVQATLFAAYKKVGGFDSYGNRLLTIGEALSDNVVLVNNTGRYNAETINTAFSHFDLWDGSINIPWGTINDCNLVLKFADAAVGGTPELKAVLKAEAKFLRALSYHNLAKVYGYEPGRVGAATNLAVPLRLKPTEALSDAAGAVRATNVEVYTQIKKDLLEAIPDLAVAATTPTRQRANKGAAQALLARVYLFEGSWAQASQLATDAIANAGTASLMSSAANFAASYPAPVVPAATITTLNQESLFELSYNGTAGIDFSQVDGTNESLASMIGTFGQTATLPNGTSILAIGASDELIAAYEPGDFRRTLWDAYGTAPNLNYKTRKWTAKHSPGPGVDFIPIIRLAELYLIRAEANSELNSDALAVADVNVLRTSRGLPGLIVVNQTGAALKAAILRERRVEFAIEGHRWFDLKRKGIDINKPAKSVARGALAIIPATSFLMLSFIPQSEINVNPKLVQNPGY